MSVKAFGTASPGPDAVVTGSGSSSLEFCKKAISFYMPNKEKWDERTGRGNPTQSREVKELMQRVLALGGGRRKKEVNAGSAFPVVEGDGPTGLLQRVQAQNTEFIGILTTMGSALQTFSRSVDQMKSALETNNIAIRHELAKGGSGEASGIVEGDANEEEAEPEQAPVDLPAMESEMKESAAQVAETLQVFNKAAAGPMSDIRIYSGADGFCTFSSANGKQIDVPEGFQLPSCDLFTAWRHFIAGFPAFKVKNEDGTVVDAPIRPLRFVNTSDLPQSLKKKFKDGWRPILLSMQGDVAHMLEATPLAAVDEKFVSETYNVAMSALVQKAPAMFSDSTTEKCATWKVATWSRKIREQQLGQQQVRRRQEGVEVAMMPAPEQPTQHLGQRLPTSPMVPPKAGDPSGIPMHDV